MMSISVLKALTGKPDIKRLSPSILYLLKMVHLVNCLFSGNLIQKPDQRTEVFWFRITIL